MAGQRDTEPTQAATYPHRTKPCSCETPNPLDTASADRNVSGYLGKAAAALHPGDPQAAREWADGQKLRVLHGRARAVAATLASVAARTRAKASTRHLDLTDVDKAVTYLTNNHAYMRYDKALAAGWPIATGVIEGACRFVPVN
jgi:hypothetical protein